MAELPEKLLVNIEVTQRKVEKQLAKIAKQAGASAKGVEDTFKRSNKKVAKTFDSSSFAAGNLASQLNDIGVQLASGTSPFTVMVQQGSQVTQALNQAGGSASALGAVFKGAFAQILNPISLATFAIIGLGGAAIQYFTSTQDGTKEADAALKAHAEVIKAIKGAYGEAAAGLNEYRNETIDVVQTLARANLETLKEQLRSLTTEILKTSDLGTSGLQQINFYMEMLNAAVAQGKDTTAIQEKLNEALASGGQSAIAANSKYAVFTDSIQRFIDSINNGTPDVIAFRTEVAKIANANKGNAEIQALASNILDLTTEADKLQRAMGAATDAISAIGGVAAGQISDVNSLNKALSELARIAVPAMSTAEQIKANVNKGLRAIGDATTLEGAEARRRLLIAGSQAQQRLDAQHLPGGGDIPVPTDKPSLLDYDPSGRSSRRSGGGGSSSNAYQSGIQSIKDRTAALQAQNAALAQINPLENDYDAAVTKARVTQQLLNDAQKAGLEITPQLKATIDAVAQGYTNASVEAQKLAESQRQAQQTAQEFAALGKDVMGGFIHDLQQGKSASEALANALQKVADKLLDIALNSLFDAKGGGGGLFGGLLGGIGKIFGFADGGVMTPSGPRRLKKFARGGVSNTAAIFGEAGPEAAVPLPDGRRIPVDLRNAGKGSGAQPVAINVNVAGANGDQHVISLVKQGVSQGITEYDKNLDRSFGARMTKAQGRQL